MTSSMFFPGDGTLDQVKAPQADVTFGGHKATGLAAGVASTDAATVGQLPSGSSAVPSWAGTTNVAAFQRFVLPDGGKGYCSVARTTRAFFDATEQSFWTYEAGGHVVVFGAAVTNWLCPNGITQAWFRLVGAGGSGGAAGSDALTSGIGTQAGGGGGGAGGVTEVFVTGLVPGTTYIVAIGTGGAGPAGGAASTGAAGNGGSAGTGGGNTTVTINGVTYTALGGSRGSASTGKSTATVGGGLPATGAARGNTVAGIPGGGGVSNSYSLAQGSVIGGGGGAPSTATPKGGAGGNAATSPGQLVDAPSGTPTATANGANGTTATVPGCGGGGGGGGGAGGAGGNGGAGADGLLVISF
ncbi:hypothetical protein [Jatrophihabitans sp.]|uniref:glycine-rich domain-containing protein n=1 Tax=Jatrophihabitans sp. TaxID=1932789 RepID=UPI0030C6DAD0|nr:Polysaccharide deacetylase [Jatrophihabitans sp.]